MAGTVFEQRYSETILTDNPDFVALASAFGIKGQRITDKSEVNAALDELLNSEGAYLLQVSINELENVWPLVPPGAVMKNDGETIMMQHQISILARFRPEVLERILGSLAIVDFVLIP